MAELAFPKPSGEFEWVQASWGAALRCGPLADIARHYFTTRDLRLEGSDEDLESWNVLARALDIEIDTLVRLRQVHGAEVFAAEKGSGSHFRGQQRKSLPEPFPEADIAVSDDPSLALSVRAADCVPILLADRCRPAVAAVHAGWKGTAAGAAMAAVRALAARFGSEPADLVAAVGPSIGPCCYEVGPDLQRHFAAHPEASRWFSSNEARPRLDLWRASRDQLERAGVPSAQIHVSALCTFDHPALFPSYRRDGRIAGRLVAAIRSAPGRTP